MTAIGLSRTVYLRRTSPCSVCVTHYPSSSAGVQACLGAAAVEQGFLREEAISHACVDELGGAHAGVSSGALPDTPAPGHGSQGSVIATDGTRAGSRRQLRSRWARIGALFIVEADDGEAASLPEGVSSRTVDYSNVIVMLARQRSGTNPLRDVLDAHPELFCLPEVFHPEPSTEATLEVETNYFHFLERHTRGDIKRVLVSEKEQERVFLDYLEFLRCFSDKRYAVIDVKYNSTHRMDGPWREITAQPTMFLLIKRHGLRVLNLTRRNYLRYYLSWTKANMTGHWTASDHRSRTDPGRAGAKDEAVTLPPDGMLFMLELCRSENELIDRMLGWYRRYFEIEYEDLFPVIGAPASTEVLGSLAAWLGIENSFPPDKHPRYRKQAVLPLADTIRNYDEIAAALRGTEFEYCLEDERPYKRIASEA